ncbi:TRAP transporter small permease [Pseudomonas sp. MT3]|uniref:TRAP transporter small permease n=1 Tax=Pseudomonas sp. ATCC 13867 TaxID=1294143 RepID=UPI0002C4E598|nr:TRAP transporter small permease [Pseudomonas sp. ATCC 13867]AGI24801.1 dicarboxylate transporter [Pseudomonas sp. ATCC 13867]RFQ16614.1 TRAP transporter small permease [Pseudomonas sp. ATCC 13867]
MNALWRVWDHFEEGFIAFLLAAMTLVTFVYVVLNNLYTLFYNLADRWEAASDTLFAIGDAILAMAQAMTWSNALTKALFAWLIFFGLAYGVRTAGHIGVDALVKLAPRHIQRIIGVVACLCSLGYAGLIAVASFEWMQTLFTAAIGAEDLGHFGVQQWHIGLILPLGFSLMFIRFVEILWRILKGRQTGLGLADEAAEVLKLTEQDDGPHKEEGK